MHPLFSRTSMVIALVFLLFTACGESEAPPPLSITGTVTIDEAETRGDSPVFAAVFRGSASDMSLQDMADSFAGMTTVAPDGSFSVDLSDKGLSLGETVTLIGFVDRNFSGNIPNPDAGDLLGFYRQEGALTPDYPLQSGINRGADIHINREVFDYDKEIGGTLTGPYTGPVHLVAYAGDLRSLDVTTLDVDPIVGYASFEKKEEELAYRLKILPYGFDLPISDVYLLAFFDTNGNGHPDPGESVGTYTRHPKGLPTLLTLTEADQDPFTFDSRLALPLPAPSSEKITLTGQVEALTGYDTQSPSPLFIMAAETEDPQQLIDHPMAVIRSFYRLDPGELNFSLDLAATGLAPGDKIMVLALWDKNYKENPDTPSYTGFPDPDAGDFMGYYQDKATFTVAHPLTAGINFCVPSDDPQAPLHFQVNRKQVEHHASIVFKIESDNGVTLEPGDPILVIAVQKDGVNADFHITDPDYIVAMKSLPAAENIDADTSVPVMGALLEPIVNTPFGVNEVYVFAILDENGNGKPDTGESFGFYGEKLFPLLPLSNLNPLIPKTTDLKNEANRLDLNLRFTGQTI
ncbi:hypothetical protein [Desulfoluna sp.]|uniref:hypothetical protein n=1 Tax=Desulfoluna sp. TaxID=2045199 RepID=UPI002602DECC|nr:hypothetical protein [Desulfoluna sp.]